MNNKSLSALAVAMLVVSALHADVSDDIRFRDAVKSEIDKRVQVSDPKRTTLKVTARDGSIYYVDAVEGPTEYIHIDDYIAAHNAAREKIEEEDKRTVQESHRKHIENQPHLKAYAEMQLSRLNFDMQENIYIDKRLADRADGIKFEIENTSLKVLQKCCRAKDWLNALNVIYSILHDGQIKVHYDMFPCEDEIDELYSGITNYRFLVQWTISSDIDIVAYGRDMQEIVGSLGGSGETLLDNKRPHIQQGQFAGGMFVLGAGVSKKDMISNISLLSGAKIFLGFKDGPEYGPCNKTQEDFDMYILMSVVGEEKSYVIPGISVIVKERYDLNEKLNSGKISPEAYEKGISSVQDKYKASFDAIFIRLNDAKEFVAKDREEQKRRYPIEQKERAEYAEKMLSEISFKLGSYCKMQKDLWNYVSTCEVTERDWATLKDMQLKKDWLGMLNVIGGTSMSDYPSINTIENMIEKLKKREFHLALKFTHDNLRIVEQAGIIGEHKTHYDKEVADELIVRFKMANQDIRTNKCIIYCPSAKDNSTYGWGNCNKKAGEKRAKIEKDMELGRIDKTEYEHSMQQVQEETETAILEWLDMAVVENDWMRPISGRTKIVRDKPSSIGNNSGKSKAGGKTKSPTKAPKIKWIECPNCEGTRYISKGSCDNCGGTGKTRTPVRRALGGTMGGRLTQCDKCRGKGEIKESCKECNGRGKIKEEY